MNNKIAFEKKIILAKITLTFKNFLFTVKAFNNSLVPLGDVECYWPKNKSNYLICVLDKIKKTDIESDAFKQSLSFCNANKMRLLVIAMEYENNLFDYVVDSEQTSKLPFKIIPFHRISQLNSDFFKVNANDPDITTFFRKEILKGA